MVGEFAASAQYSGNPEDLLEAAVYYCALKGARLDVRGKHFVSPTPSAPQPTPTEQTMQNYYHRYRPSVPHWRILQRSWRLWGFMARRGMSKFPPSAGLNSRSWWQFNLSHSGLCVL